MTYTYTKDHVSISRLIQEIHNSIITVALDYINAIETELDIIFKSSLTPDEKAILDVIVTNHTGESLPEDIKEVEIANALDMTPGDLVITWTQMKSFYDSISSTCMLNYIDLTCHYYIWLKFQDQKMYVPALVKGTAECTQFEASYKSKCNIAEWPRVRTTTCKSGRKMHNRFVTFKTACSDPEWQFDNTDENNNDFNDLTYIMKDASGHTTTDFTICKETWLDWMPSWDYELSGGSFFVPSTLPGNLDDWEVHVIAVPDIPAQYGGYIRFISNPRIKWLLNGSLEIVSDNNPSELKYSATYKTNKIRFIVKHTMGQSSEFQFSLRLFK